MSTPDVETKKMSDAKKTDSAQLKIAQEEYMTRRFLRLLDPSRFGAKKFTDLSDTLKPLMPEAYQENERTMKIVEGTCPGIPRHKNQRSIQRGGAYLKIDIAGSGHKSFRSDHLGLTGKSTYANDKNQQVKRTYTDTSWYNRALGGWLGIKTPAQIAAQNLQLSWTLKQYRQFIGERMDVGRKDVKHVTKRVTDKSTKITMAGPLALGGMINAGKYSIENLRRYIFESGKQFIEEQIKLRASDAGKGPEDITIELRGHSRGGVASIEGGMMLKAWIKNEHPDLMSKVKFRLLQNDPVPGMGSMTGHDSYDHSRDGIFLRDGLEMMPLGNSADTTVLYSMHTEHNVGFTPQTIKGAKRVILTPFKHMVGLKDVEESTRRREGFVYNGETYGSRGLNDLPNGVYIVDETNNLLRFENAKQAKEVLDKVLPKTSEQGSRHNIMQEVTKNWFDLNSEPQKEPSAVKSRSVDGPKSAAL